jgi:hypothetical protein
MSPSTSACCRFCVATASAMILLMVACKKSVPGTHETTAPVQEGQTASQLQTQTDTASPDGTYIATVAEKLAQETTGTIPQLYLRRSSVARADAAHVFDGDLNGRLQVTWTGPQSLSVVYTAEPGGPKLPAATNVDGVTITARQP